MGRGICRMVGGVTRWGELREHPGRETGRDTTDVIWHGDWQPFIVVESSDLIKKWSRGHSFFLNPTLPPPPGPRG